MSNIRLGIVEVVGVRVVAQDNKGGRFYRKSGSREDAPFSYVILNRSAAGTAKLPMTCQSTLTRIVEPIVPCPH